MSLSFSHSWALDQIQESRAAAWVCCGNLLNFCIWELRGLGKHFIPEFPEETNFPSTLGELLFLINLTISIFLLLNVNENEMMKNRRQFSRRFSLQPSSLKEGQEEGGNAKNTRSERLSESDGARKQATESSVRHKIVVMGAAKVGKSAIINQFLYGTFSPKYKRTIEEMHHGDFNVSGIQLTLDILDTSGSYEFPAMRDLSIQSADAFILVYDVNDSSTFLEVKTLKDKILATKGVVPIVVVGNKVDLVEECQEVDSENTRTLVTKDWENGYVEVSAKENLNIAQVFKELLVQAKVKYNLSPALRRRRKSLPPPQYMSSRSSNAHVPSPAQLQHLQQIRERSESKRNSCILS
ncbi:ras-related protein rapB [Cephus cinctus]|uniref:Ras-related protein rapB n=1 Tax=Cephus cinctus TaxID=211228 RepID=A0AAJ7W2P0_CEPCN|nr:ras-related protein rapB [Cephus cinctus]